MVKSIPTEHQVLSRHSFTRRRVRYLLPLTMLGGLILCTVVSLPSVRFFEAIGLTIVIYVAVSTLVSVCELTVVETGLIVNRLILPKRFTPWDSIERVSVLKHQDTNGGTLVEIATIGFYEGLSPLNALVGLIYGNGFRQTIVVMRDSVENYDALLDSLNRNCLVVETQARR